VPPSFSTVPLATPPADTFATPPLLTTVDLAIPPDSTSSSSPLLTTMPLLVAPEATVKVVMQGLCRSTFRRTEAQVKRENLSIC
jgi:hypothetical protein